MNCIKLNGFVFELELNPKVYKTVEKLFKGNTTTRAWRWTQIRNVGEKGLDHFICTRKTTQKTTTSLNPSALHTQVLVFWPIKKSDFSTCYSSSRSNPEQKSWTDTFTVHPRSRYEALCVSDSVSVWINLALHKMYDFRFQRDRLELIRRMKWLY